MDGFAVRAADTPGRLPVVERIAAGRPAPRALQAGETMGIATGGVVPEGADAVVPIERVTTDGDQVEIEEPAASGANVRPRGGDVAAGGVVVSAGVRLGPQQIGALAAAGVGEVRCASRPRVAVLTTGTELRRAGRRARAGGDLRVERADAACPARLGRRRGRTSGVGRRRRGCAPRSYRARSRARRPRHVRRRVRRPARPRAPHRGGARGRGGLLGRVREAGQAARFRRPRADARLRPAGQSRVVPGLQRALRAPRSARAAGRA